MDALSVSLNPSQSNPYQTAPKREETAHPGTNPPKDTQKDPKTMAAIAELSSIDTKVRAHEAAHLAAGGGVVSGGATYSYTRGPDGKMYATGGEVPISVGGGKTPQETIQKARQIASAALAPADPSPQDYKVAATAAMMEMRAHLEMTKELQNALKGEKTYGSAAAGGKPTETVPSDTLSPAESPGQS